MVDTLFLGSLPYSGRDTTLTGSLHLTWGKRITEKSPICRQRRRREPTGRKIATKRGNRFLNNNNASMRLHASEQLSQGGKRPGGETGSPLLGQCVMRRRTGTSAPSALPVKLMAAKKSPFDEPEMKFSFFIF